MDITGRIIAAMPPKSGTSQRGDWKIQEFVIESQGRYPSKMVFEVFGEDRINRFNIQVGQDVTVGFDIDAREFNGKWFNTVRAFDVRPSAGSQPYYQQPPQQIQQQPQQYYGNNNPS